MINIRVIKTKAIEHEKNLVTLKDIFCIGNLIIGEVGEDGEYFSRNDYSKVADEIDEYTRLAIIRMR